MPKNAISIIIPVFNAANTLPRVFSCLLAQSIGFERLEIVFADDCSKDNSHALLLQFASEHDNVRVVKTEANSGVAGKARNLALKSASSPFVMFLDADDSYTKNACEILYNAIINSNADLVSGYAVHVDEDGHLLKTDDYGGLAPRTTNLPQQLREELVLRDAFWCKIYKRAMIVDNDLHFLEGVPGEDIYFLYSYILCAASSQYLAVPIYRYTQTTGSVMRQPSASFYIGLGQAYREMQSLFAAKDAMWAFDLIVDQILQSHLCGMADSRLMSQEDIAVALPYWQWLFAFEQAQNTLCASPVAAALWPFIEKQDWQAAAAALRALAPLRNAQSEAQNELARWQKHARDLQDTLDAMRNSRIWRITHLGKRGQK